MKPGLANLGVGGRGDHRRELQGEAQHLWPLRFARAQPAMDGAGLLDPGDDGDGRGVEQIQQARDHLSDRQRHRLQVGVIGVQIAGASRSLLLHSQ